MDRIEKGNEEICKYLNLPLMGKNHYTYIVNGEPFIRPPKYMKFHESFDWLIPVLQKMATEKLIGAENHTDVCYPITFGMPSDHCTWLFRIKGFMLHESKDWITGAWEAVVEVAEYKNRQ